jgi:hypothetical protein
MTDDDDFENEKDDDDEDDDDDQEDDFLNGFRQSVGGSRRVNSLFDSNMTYLRSLNMKPKKERTFGDFVESFWKCVINDPVYKKEMTKRAHFKGINSVSRCDRVSRILFPFSFLLLNILYWYKYYS